MSATLAAEVPADVPVPVAVAAEPKKRVRRAVVRRSTADVPPVIGPLPRDMELVARLERDGYAIIRSVLTEHECDEARSHAWDWFEELAPNVSRDDPSAWNSKNVPQLTGGLTKGLVQFYGVGWNKSDVYVRDRIKGVFASIYGTERLWTSFGGFSISKRPKDRFCAYKDLADWEAHKFDGGKLHSDQTRTSVHLCYQSGVALTAQPEDGHVFVCVPGSHLWHAELLAMGDTRKVHWMELTDAQMQFLKSKGLAPVRVSLNRGDMVLWDSRTVHSNSGWCATAPQGAERLQSLICMGPAPAVGTKNHDDEVAFRRECYANNITGKHSYNPTRAFPRIPRKYGPTQYAPDPLPPAELTLEQMWLHGLEPYPPHMR